MKTINIEITIKDLQNLLEKHLVIKDKEKFAELVVGHLSKTNVSLEQTYKALIGIYPEFKYKKGDWIYVPLNGLPTWRMDEEKTKALPGVMGNNLPCEITRVNTYDESCYDIVFTYIPNGSDLKQLESYSVKENYVVKKVENLEDILDEMEQLQINSEDVSS